MRRLLGLLVLILCACGTEPVAPGTSPPPSSTNSLEATPVPWTDRDIKSILIVDGDLPAGLKAGQIDTLTAEFDHMPRPAQYVTRKIDNSAGQNVGLVAVLLYESSMGTAGAYEVLTQSRLLEPLPDVGEAAKLNPGIVINLYELVFRRCHATVDIQLTSFEPNSGERLDPNIITNLASRLDERLQKVAC